STGGSASACGQFPSFPDASCTGVPAGVTLKTCSSTLTASNTTYDGCLFNGGLTGLGSNIKVTRSKITGLWSRSGNFNGSLRGLVLQDVEIDGSSMHDPYGQAAIGLDDYTCVRCNVHNTGRGANFRDNVHIEDSYFHDFVYVNEAHQSGVGSNGGHGN